MELLEFITKLSNASFNSEEEKYWRVTVNCFLVDGFEQIQLGMLPGYFKQYYGRAPAYDGIFFHSFGVNKNYLTHYSGKLSTLLQEPEFKAICLIKKYNTTLWLEPSSFLLRVITAQLTPIDTKEFKNGVNSNNNSNNNNTNELKVSIQNPFAELAQKEVEGSEQNDEARFGRVALEELNCGVCFELLQDAVEASCCSTLFCLPCIERNARKCPNCRKLAEWAVNQPIRRLIAKKPARCTYEECNAWSTLGEIEQHLIKCEFNPNNALVACQHCLQQMARYLLDKHVNETCLMTKAPCRSCGWVVLRQDLPRHEEQICELRSVTFPKTFQLTELHRRVACPYNCGTHMTFKEYNEQHYSKCDYVPVKCSNQRCNLQVQKRLLRGHLQVCEFSKISCPHSVRGCKAQFTKANKAFSDKHAGECRFKLVRCPWGCNQEMLKRNAKKHECDYMPEECEFCHQEYRIMDLDSHERVCPTRPITCPNRCNQKVTAGTYNQHLESCPQRQVMCRDCKKQMAMASTAVHWSTDCPKRLVPCSKCKKQVAFDALENHLSNQCPKRIIYCAWCEVTSDSDSCHKKTCLRRCVCGQPITLEDYLHHSKYECSAKSECKYCGERVWLHVMSEHRALECVARQVSCPLCKKSVAISKLDAHTTEECLERTIMCPRCYDKMSQSDFILRHYGNCPATFRSCPHCNTSMSRKDYDSHVENCKKKDEARCIIS